MRCSTAPAPAPYPTREEKALRAAVEAAKAPVVKAEGKAAVRPEASTALEAPVVKAEANTVAQVKVAVSTAPEASGEAAARVNRNLPRGDVEPSHEVR